MGFGSDLFGGGGSDGGFEQIPLTPEQKKAQDFLMNLLGEAPDIPGRGTAGLTDLELQSQNQLKDFAGLDQPEILTSAINSLNNIIGAAPDVRESPGFQAFLEESERLRGLGQSQIARTGQGRTGGFSQPTARQSSDFDVRTNNNILGELGRRQELERQVQLQAIPQALNLASAQTAFPLKQLGAVQQFGGLPRQIDQNIQDALFNQQLQTVLFPFQTQAPIASNILNRDAFVFQQGTPDSGGSLDQILGLAGKLGGGSGAGGDLSGLLGGLGGIFGGAGAAASPFATGALGAGGLGLSSLAGLGGGATAGLGALGAGGAGGAAAGSGFATGALAAGGTGLASLAFLSDERLKDNIIEIENALDKVDLLTGYTYHYKFREDEEDRNGGVMSKDVKKALPDAVSIAESGYEVVKYDAVIGLLVNAVKELSNKVKILEKSKEI